MEEFNKISPRRYLEERVIYCANCDCNRKLHSSPSGPVCQTCASGNWMYMPSHIPARLHRPMAEAVKVLSNVGLAIIQKVVELSQPSLAPVRR